MQTNSEDERNKAIGEEIENRIQQVMVEVSDMYKSDTTRARNDIINFVFSLL